jgi:isopenicillin N synthase-like dioxygenase
MRIGQHTDVGILTLLDRQPGAGGLQVRTLGGEWVDVPFVPGALTVNAGDLLARWTGDRWRSTPHRVLPPPVEIPTEELSPVFFHEADPLTLIETLPTAAAGSTRYEPVTAGQLLRRRMDSITVG